MARLSAHGPELIRISCETDTPKSDLTIWERTTRTYHADGVVLEKRDVRFKPSHPLDPPEGRRHTWGWKKLGKVKGDPREQALAAIKIVEAGSKTNWKVEFRQAGL